MCRPTLSHWPKVPWDMWWAGNWIQIPCVPGQWLTQKTVKYWFMNKGYIPCSDQSGNDSARRKRWGTRTGSPRRQRQGLWGKGNNRPSIYGKSKEYTAQNPHKRPLAHSTYNTCFLSPCHILTLTFLTVPAQANLDLVILISSKNICLNNLPFPPKSRIRLQHLRSQILFEAKNVCTCYP